MHPLLELENVSFSYRTGHSIFSKWKTRKRVLQDLSFDILRGETLGILGRNGAGKSTLLRLLSGIVVPDSGNIIKNCRKVSLLSIELGFSGQLTGIENIFLSGLYNSFSKREISALMPEIIAFADIGNAIHDPLITYSSGMRARLGFSIAYFLKPDLLLIDEILGVGDIDFQVKSERLMKAKIQSDQTVVLVTHDPNLVRSVCTRALWIENGRLQSVGPTGQVVDEYLAHMLPEESR